MDASADVGSPHVPRHRKGATSAVLRSMMPGNHQSKPASQADACERSQLVSSGIQDGLLAKHPHIRHHAREKSSNQDFKPLSPSKSMEATEKDHQALGSEKRSKSSKSLKSLVEKEEAKSPKKMKESKSSTGLSALLSRPKATKDSKAEANQRDKENQTPMSASNISSPPIWAQFATQPMTDVSVVRIPLNDRHNMEGVATHAPFHDSPSKSRKVETYQQPTLARKSDFKPRPKSECLTASTSQNSFSETLNGLRRSERGKCQAAKIDESQQALDEKTNAQNFSHRRPKSEHGASENGTSASNATVAKLGSRVMAAVAAFNGKQKDLPNEPTVEPGNLPLDAKVIEKAFESLLDARNVPQATRDKMRTLDTSIKADFIRKDKKGSGSAASAESLALHSRPNTGNGSMNEDIAFGYEEVQTGQEDVVTSKKPRPRSGTFTFSRGDQSPSKKQKSSRPACHDRSKSGELTTTAATRSLTSVGAAQGMAFLGRSSKPAMPGDYISYLRKTQKPESVEVGKIHKLRQLLRNETVGWVDAFIAEDGMTEVVGLLYRIIEIEWREDHEDTLLHETLLCIKALSTTSSALQQLSTIHTTLFPTLLKMLFDEEKKGPSEFSTRTIIVSLLFTYLSASSISEPSIRARNLLAYLRDQGPPEAAQPPGFISSIYHPRPYRVWNREIVNVTKEVFWIFLHHLNVVPYPSQESRNIDPASYFQTHFPKEHPPVPAAPYIGGVEWDATAYITAHLDLLNGLIASLPNRDERNALRQELKDSGFEKVMGISLRTCKEKFYGSVHDTLAAWVAASMADGWPVRDVREGPPKGEVRSQSRSPQKKKGDEAPKLDMPNLDLGGHDDENCVGTGWL